MADPRVVAARVLARLLRQQGSLATLLPDAEQALSEQDRQFCRELCYGTARYYSRLNRIIEQLLDKPLRQKDQDVAALLLLGAYQLRYLRTPDHAAINATVQAAVKFKKPWAKGLINGVLRRLQRDAAALDSRLRDDPVYRHAHPAWLIEAIQQAWPQHADSVFAANNAHPPFSLRVNRQRFSREQYLQELEQQGIAAEPCRYSGDGIVLDEAMPAPALPHFDAGAISVQDEAPQLCAGLMQLQPGQRVLDACAAPGGKTAHLLEAEPALAEVMALDVSEQRNRRTAENLERLRLHAQLVTGDATSPASWFNGEPFDRILIDAPCSATGIIRRQPDIKILRQHDAIAKLAHTQQQMLCAVWPLLKPGGLLLYATCSVLPAENVDVVNAFVAATPDAREELIDAAWGEAQAVGRQLLPTPAGPDGFYYARLRKTGNPSH